MKSFAASLTHKLGPLPIWAWLATAAAALLVFRRLGGGGAGSSGAAGVQPSAGGSPGFGVGSFAGGGDGSLPSGQQTVDPGVTGPGTPVVFDPTPGAGDEPPLSDALPPNTGDTSPTIPRTTVPGNTQGPRAATHGSEIPTDPTKAFVAGLGLFPKPKKHKTQPTRPRSTRGQTAPVHRAPELVSEHGRGQATVPHPLAVAHVAPAPATRAQEHAPASAAPVRSLSEAHPDAGARTPASASPVGVPTTPAQYRGMGRKMETG